MAEEDPRNTPPGMNVDDLLTGIREDADAWDTSDEGTPEHERCAAELVERIHDLDQRLSHGGRFPVPWMDSTRCRDT